jgi:hypothetical protein
MLATVAYFIFWILFLACLTRLFVIRTRDSLKERERERERERNRDRDRETEREKEIERTLLPGSCLLLTPKSVFSLFRSGLPVEDT